MATSDPTDLEVATRRGMALVAAAALDDDANLLFHVESGEIRERLLLSVALLAGFLARDAAALNGVDVAFYLARIAPAFTTIEAER